MDAHVNKFLPLDSSIKLHFRNNLHNREWNWKDLSVPSPWAPLPQRCEQLGL